MRLASARPNAHGELIGSFLFVNPWSAAHMLTHLAEEDGTDPELGGPEVSAWASAIVASCRQSYPASEVAECVARTIHHSVQQTIAFVHEKGEQFQSARTTIRTGKGDCDCHARLVYALARAAGLPAGMAYFDDHKRVQLIAPGDPVPPDDGSQPVHVVPLLPSKGRKLVWAETTIPADFGEEPYSAFARLKAQGFEQTRDELAS